MLNQSAISFEVFRKYPPALAQEVYDFLLFIDSKMEPETVDKISNVLLALKIEINKGDLVRFITSVTCRETCDIERSKAVVSTVNPGTLTLFMGSGYKLVLSFGIVSDYFSD